MKTIKLNNGVDMPLLGYGVFQVSPTEAARCVRDALRIGYRMIDTAQAYQNEEGVGEALRQSGIPREEIFLVDKIWMGNFEGEAPAKSIDESLRKLGVDYIDLMLLHQPFGDRYNAYRALEDAYRAGKVRAIGVSNFYPDHLIDLAHFNDIVPAVNQIETHIFSQQHEARSYMDELGVAHMSWGSLAEGKNNIFTNEVLTSIGAKYQKSPAQVALRYLLQLNTIVIPKSVRAERMQENFELYDFELSSEDLEALRKLDTGKTLIMPSHHDAETTKFFMNFVPR